jgi:hypothetical protein
MSTFQPRRDDAEIHEFLTFCFGGNHTGNAVPSVGAIPAGIAATPPTSTSLTASTSPTTTTTTPPTLTTTATTTATPTTSSCPARLAIPRRLYVFLPDDILSLERSHEAFGRLEADSRITITLPRKNAVAGSVLLHCSTMINSVLSRKEPTAFKIGVTKCPVHRFYHARYGYADCYDSMLVLYATSQSIVSGFVEAHLISVFKPRVGCHNDAPGGEGTGGSQPGPFFVYCVFKQCGPWREEIVVVVFCVCECVFCLPRAVPIAHVLTDATLLRS